MAKKSSPVVLRKKEPASLVLTVAQQLLAERAARRRVDIETGRNRTSGCGRHEGTDRMNNRRDRKSAKLRIQRGED